MTLFRRSEIYLTTRSSIYPTRYLTAWRIWSICELYIFCYCYTIIFIWCLHYMRMTRFAIICIFLLWCSTFWRDEKRDEPSVIFGFIPWSFLLTRRIFFFFFFFYLILLLQTHVHNAAGRYTKINWKSSTRKYSSPTSIWKRCKLSLTFLFLLNPFRYF